MLVTGIIQKVHFATGVFRKGSYYPWTPDIRMHSFLLITLKSTPLNVMICAKDLEFVDTASVTNNSGHL